jgi:DNA-binding XRE family transcriptional regulator
MPATLRAVASKIHFHNRMEYHKSVSIRYHRVHSGLSQRELAYLLGYSSEGQVIRHERGTAVPPLLIALAYEAIFRRRVSELFPEFFRTVEQGIEMRIEEMERDLQNKSTKGRKARGIARKLEWVCARRNGFEF